MEFFTAMGASRTADIFEVSATPGGAVYGFALGAAIVLLGLISGLAPERCSSSQADSAADVIGPDLNN